MVETAETTAARVDTTPATQARYQLRARASPTSVKSAPVLKRTPSKAATPVAGGKGSDTSDTVDPLPLQLESSASPSTTLLTIAPSPAIPETSAPTPNIHSPALLEPADQLASAAMPESAQGSLSFNVGPELSASTAPFVSARTIPLSGTAEHMDRFLAEAANPLLATPTSDRPTTASDIGTRRALMFSAGQGSTTPAMNDV